MYTGIKFYDEIVESGFLGEWPSKVPKEVIWRLAIKDVAGSGWSRWRGLPSGTTNITQAHALADTGIMYYLIDHCNGEVKLTEDSVSLTESDGSTRQVPVLRFHIGDVNKILPVIEQLALHVQRMASTADVELVNTFMNTYAASTRNPAYADIVTNMRNVCNHGVIETADVFPELEPVYGENREIIDITASAPSGPLQYYKKLYALSSAGAP